MFSKVVMQRIHTLWNRNYFWQDIISNLLMKYHSSTRHLIAPIGISLRSLLNKPEDSYSRINNSPFVCFFNITARIAHILTVWSDFFFPLTFHFLDSRFSWNRKLLSRNQCRKLHRPVSLADWPVAGSLNGSCCRFHSNSLVWTFRAQCVYLYLPPLPFVNVLGE